MLVLNPSNYTPKFSEKSCTIFQLSVKIRLELAIVGGMVNIY